MFGRCGSGEDHRVLKRTEGDDPSQRASLVAQIVKNRLQHWRPGFNPWIRKTPGEGSGCPLHYSCLENPTNRGAWRITWGNEELHTTEQLSTKLLLKFIISYQILGDGNHPGLWQLHPARHLNILTILNAQNSFWCKADTP